MVAAGVTCCCCCCCLGVGNQLIVDRKSTRLNSSHSQISYAVFCLKKKKNDIHHDQLVLVVPRSPPDREPAATLRLLAGGVWKDDCADCLLLVLEILEHQTLG